MGALIVVRPYETARVNLWTESHALMGGARGQCLSLALLSQRVDDLRGDCVGRRHGRPRIRPCRFDFLG